MSRCRTCFFARLQWLPFSTIFRDCIHLRFMNRNARRSTAMCLIRIPGKVKEFAPRINVQRILTHLR